MENQSLLARKIKVETNALCDLDIEGHNRIIPKGKYLTQIIGGDDIKAQGQYHGKQCYDAALEHYKTLEKRNV